MRLLICAGGTGGGVYPALSILQALRQKQTDLDVLWVGGEGGMEADLVARVNIPFKSLPAAGLHGVGWKQIPGNLLMLGRGLLAARRILRQFQADAILVTGGFVAAPIALIGHRIPLMLYTPDIEPGLALKMLSRFADRIALTAENSRQYFSQKDSLTVTGYPTRADLKEWTRQQALQALELDEHLPVLLVFGGSKGARSINRALLAVLPELLPETQVVHISGKLDWNEVQTKAAHLPVALQSRYRPFPYLHERMGAALRAADLVVSRAGASILGEFPLFGLPAILVPYPYAWRYQKINADYLADRGAAVIIQDAELTDRLLPQVRELLKNSERKNTMCQAMHALAAPQASSQIASLLTDLPNDFGGGRK